MTLVTEPIRSPVLCTLREHPAGDPCRVRMSEPGQCRPVDDGLPATTRLAGPAHRDLRGEPSSPCTPHLTTGRE